MSTPEKQKHEPLATAMGVGSVGLGLPMTTVPDRFLKVIGVEPDATARAITLGVGAQEWGAAAGIFAVERQRPLVTMWSRFGADLLHLGLLAAAWQSKKRKDPVRLGAAMAYVAGCAAVDFTGALRLTRDPSRTAVAPPVDVKASTTVRAKRSEVYALWRDFENLPAFMFHLESVESSGDRRSHWKAKGPAGKTVEWDAEITEDEPGEVISWKSLEGASVENSGTVRFMDAPRDQGTEIHVHIRAKVPGGTAGQIAAKLFGEEPEEQAKDDLRRFKQIVETGEVVRSEGSPEGQTTRRLLKQRPAQPPEESVDQATAPAAGIEGSQS